MLAGRPLIIGGRGFQVASPASDFLIGTAWNNSDLTGINLFDYINDPTIGVESDADYVRFTDNAGGGNAIYGGLLTSGKLNPNTSSGLYYRIRARVSAPAGVIGMHIKLANNSGAIFSDRFLGAAGSHPPANDFDDAGTLLDSDFRTFVHTLDAAEVALINWASQPFRFEFVGGGNFGATTYDISVARFDIPRV